MDAGKLDTRIGVYRLNQTTDGYGGFSDSPTLLTTLWANVTYLSGEMKTENGSRKQAQKIKLIFKEIPSSILFFSTDCITFLIYTSAYLFDSFK